MNQSLQDLELYRKDLFRQLENLGDFRRGTISVNYRKCGKGNCVCARKDHPGTDRSICGTSASPARPTLGIYL